VLGISRGIAHLHDENVVHRDLAARNILLNGSWEPLVSDFGMSRVIQGGAAAERQTTKSNVGPIRWMAPEQLTESAVSSAADVWAFGVILYEIYAREEPWKGTPNLKVAQFVVEGKFLRAPIAAPTVIAKAMHACFKFVDTERPTMRQVVRLLQNATGDGEGDGTPGTPASSARSAASAGRTMELRTQKQADSYDTASSPLYSSAPRKGGGTQELV